MAVGYIYSLLEVEVKPQKQEKISRKSEEKQNITKTKITHQDSSGSRNDTTKGNRKFFI